MNKTYAKNRMHFFTMTIFVLFLAIIQSCTRSPVDFAAKWTQDIKAKIIEDANQQPDKTVFDTIRHELTLYKNGKKLKYFYFAPKPEHGEIDKIISYDTAFIVFYSTDQNFQLVRQPCIQTSERSYVGVTYKGNRFGLAEFIYCNKPISETGFYYDNLNVGTWTKFDSTGKVTEKKNIGDDKKLEELKDIKYYR
jgi:hypothetical protein